MVLVDGLGDYFQYEMEMAAHLFFFFSSFLRTSAVIAFFPPHYVCYPLCLAADSQLKESVNYWLYLLYLVFIEP